MFSSSRSMSAMSRIPVRNRWMSVMMIVTICSIIIYLGTVLNIQVHQLIPVFGEQQHWPKEDELMYSDQDWLLTHLLGNITEALNQYPHITYWLEFGTALGAIREGGIIRGDHDADIAILGDETVMKEVFYILRKHLSEDTRVEVWRADDDVVTTDWPPSDSLKHPHSVNQINLEVCRHQAACYNPDVDIYNYGLHQGRLWRTDSFSNYTLEGIHSRFVPRRRGYDPVPMEYILPVRKMEYGPSQFQVNVPNEAAKYLEQRYGFIGPNAQMDTQTGLYVEKKE